MPAARTCPETDRRRPAPPAPSTFGAQQAGQVRVGGCVSPAWAWAPAPLLARGAPLLPAKPGLGPAAGTGAAEAREGGGAKGRTPGRPRAGRGGAGAGRGWSGPGAGQGRGTRDAPAPRPAPAAMSAR